MNTKEIVAGVMDLFPGADRQALQCLAELMEKDQARLRKGLVPEGWALVPREITPEMLDAAVKGSVADVSYADVEELWPAILDAATTTSN